MHTIYTTEGFILKSASFGEANKYFFIFTKDFGLIRVAGQSVRHLKSKLRYNLEDYSLGHFSVVRGREVWRLTSAGEKNKIIDLTKLALLARLFSLLVRLLHGEEKNEILFTNLKNVFLFLTETGLSTEDLINLECILALRILFNLGYLGKVGDLDLFIDSETIDSVLLNQMSIHRKQAILEINKSLLETQL
jgi:DNA repair protein RecO